jgi:lipopolysaccharide export system permease protein
MAYSLWLMAYRGKKQGLRMNILDRYFLREFLKPFVTCLFAFLLCMLVYDLYDNIKDFIEAETDLSKIIHYYIVLLPSWIVDIMPITLLLALLSVLSKFSKHGELTAMRASGLDFFRLMTPYFILGLCMAMQMLSLNIAWAANALQEAKDVFEKNTFKNQDLKAPISEVYYHDIAANRFWNIRYLDPLHNEATGIEVIESDKHQHDYKRISAATGVYLDGYWTFQNVITYDYTLGISDPATLQQSATLVAKDFTEPPSQLASKSKKTKRMSTPELLKNLRYAGNLSPKQRAEISMEFHTRIAYPLANLIVFAIGVPFGVVGQRKSGFLAIVNALLFFFGYMLSMRVLALFGQTGRLPASIAAWTPNIFFGFMGIYMIRKIR